MPSRFDGEWLRSNFPSVAQSMDRFIDKIKEETQGEILGDLEIVRIPLDLYRARNATSRQWRTTGPSDHPFASSPVFLAGDSAIGSPYFQSISLGFECAMYLAGLLAEGDLPLREMLDRYELYSYKQWLRAMRSKMIKHNNYLFSPSMTSRAPGPAAYLLAGLVGLSQNETTEGSPPETRESPARACFTPARRPPRRSTSVWRSTSAAVVAGDISAMLWNGVSRIPRFSA